MASNDIKSELESFREQWRAEVQSKVPVSKKQAEQTVAGPSNANAQPQALSKLPKVSDPPKKQVAGKKAPQPEDEEDEYVSQSFDEAAPAVSSDPSSQTLPSDNEADLVSALDHYEQAVEREAAGNLGDSLRLYRKAYRVSPHLHLTPCYHAHNPVAGPSRRPAIQKEALSRRPRPQTTTLSTQPIRRIPHGPKPSPSLVRSRPRSQTQVPEGTNHQLREPDHTRLPPRGRRRTPTPLPHLDPPR